MPDGKADILVGADPADTVRGSDGGGGAVELVMTFLFVMAAGDLDRARAVLTPDFEMTFPGNKRMTDPTQLVDWGRTRYLTLFKKIDATEAIGRQDGATVYVRGTLSGTWLDGRDFSGIRFIDRFDVRDGKISQQDVWNDIGESRKG